MARGGRRRSGAALATRIAAARRWLHRERARRLGKKAPRGFAEDHPRAALLKQKGLTAMFPAIPRGLIHKPAFGRLAGRARDRDRAAGDWLGAHVG
ncbi:MAG: hypothetical protein IPH80_38490 [Myxococcales bacterium]|nr:hypothetical protein [Myxococcales bacterium]